MDALVPEGVGNDPRLTRGLKIFHVFLRFTIEIKIPRETTNENISSGSTISALLVAFWKTR